ncbi:MAG: phage major capsid protein [Methylobacter sp.]|nr:phage major capsid protein [Methylobacter sp.]
MTALHDLHGIEADLKGYNTQGSAPDNNRLYAKGQKLAFDSVHQNLQGMSVGTIMKGMVLGANGNLSLQNALNEGTDSAGGYSIAAELLRGFVDKLRDKSVLFQAGSQIFLLDTAKTNLATVVSDPVAGWRAEAAAVNESDMVLGSVQFQPKSLAVLVKVSRELLEDSINIEEILMNSLAQGLATQLDYAGLYGSGASNQPLGLKSVLTTASRTSSIAGNGAKISATGSYNILIRQVGKVAASNDEANAFVMSPRSYYDIQGLSDTTGQPLNAPAIIANKINMLYSNSVPSTQTRGTASGICSEIFLGNFENLILGLRSQLRIEILNQTFAGNLQVGFLAHLRADWQVSRPNSFWNLTGILAE